MLFGLPGMTAIAFMLYLLEFEWMKSAKAQPDSACGLLVSGTASNATERRSVDEVGYQGAHDRHHPAALRTEESSAHHGHDHNLDE